MALPGSSRPVTQTAVFEVPGAWRRAGAETPAIDWSGSGGARLVHFGLDQLFPEAPKLSEVFNGNAPFRQQLRKAMRADLFRPSSKVSAEVNDELRSVFMDLTKPHVKAPVVERGEAGHWALRPLPRLTELLASHAVALTGEMFVGRLLELGGLLESGRFSDLVGKPHDGHRWHQDHGEERWTVMLGFPPESGFRGVGIFSHVVRLSHPLRFPRTSDGWVSGTPIVVRLQAPDECILRPEYCPGQEILAWEDSICLHSTPDVVNREALWRFM